MKPKLYGRVIDTSDSYPYVVKQHLFETEAEAKAYALGVNDAAEVADYEAMQGSTAYEKAEEE